MISFSSYGQEIKVLDTKDKPIENVIAVGDNFTSHTNQNGVLIYFPKEGTSHIAFIHPNYKRLDLTWGQLASVDFKVVMTEKMQQLDEVIVNASKRAQALSVIPQKIDVLKPNDVQLYQPQTTADLLSNSGEVFIQKSQMGGGSPMIRGFSANRILLVVDGVRMNNAIYRSGNLQNVISLDATSLEQTEIIYGPGSVIYGSDALGGVIHFHTLKPRLSTDKLQTPANAMIRYSSANFEKTAHIDFNLAGKKWASITALTFSNFNDLVMGNRQHEEYTRKHYITSINGTDSMVINSNPNEQVQSGYSQFNVIQKVRYRPSDQADFEYAFHFSNTSDIPRYDRLIQYSGNMLKYAEWYYGPQKWMMHSFKGEFTSNSELFNKLTVQAAYQNYTESRNDRKFGKTALNCRTENVDIVSFNIDADKYFSETQSLFYGLEGVYNKIHSKGTEKDISTGFEQAISSRYPDGSNWWSMATYLSYNQTLSDNAVLQAGARYNFAGMGGTFDKQFFDFPFNDFKNSDGAATVNFGMVFTPNNKWRFNINAATGFRAPNMDDAAKVFDSEPGSVIVPNPNLQPEYASSFESGIKWSPNTAFYLDFTVFYTRLFNAMVRRNGQLNGQDSILYDGELSQIQMLTNASWANIGGLSSQFLYSPTNHINLRGSLNWQTGRDSDNLPVRHVAPMFGNLHCLWKQESFNIDLYALYNGEISFDKLVPDERDKPYMYASDENGNPYSPAWWTLNLKGNYKVSEMLILSAGIENILNIRYRPYSSGIVAPGMNFIFSLNLKL